MLGDFLNRWLILVFGYAYPGFECYKTVEKNRVEIGELRFWCQYWTIVALFTVAERFTDIFISWLPFYGEMKVAFFVYLWYPKTKGTGYIYETVLRPIVSRHENDIDRQLLEWRARAWDLALHYGQHFTKLGQTVFYQVIEYMATQSARLKANPSTQKNDPQGTSAHQFPLRRLNFENKQNDISPKSKWSPSPPSSPSNKINRKIWDTPKSETVQPHHDSRTEHLGEKEAFKHEAVTRRDPASSPQAQDDLNLTRARLRRPRTPKTPRSPQFREV